MPHSTLLAPDLHFNGDLSLLMYFVGERTEIKRIHARTSALRDYVSV